MEGEDDGQVITCHDTSDDASSKKLPVLILNGTEKENLENEQVGLSKAPETTPNDVAAQGQDVIGSQFQSEGVAIGLESVNTPQKLHSPNLDEENIAIQHRADSRDSNHADVGDGGGNNTKHGNGEIMEVAPSNSVEVPPVINSTISEMDANLSAASVVNEGVSNSTIKLDETCGIPIPNTVDNLADTEKRSVTSFVNISALNDTGDDGDLEQFSEILLDSDLSNSENEYEGGDGEYDPKTMKTRKKKRVRFADEMAGDNVVGHGQRSPPPPPSSLPELPSLSLTSRHPGVPITPSSTSPKHKVPVHQFSLEELINGIEMSAEYLGSTPIILDGMGTVKSARMYQAQQAVHLIKDPESESRPRFAVKVKISTSAIILADQVTDTDLMSHPLHTITYVADIDSVLVIMAHVQPMLIISSTPRHNSDDPDLNPPPDAQEGEVTESVACSRYVPKLTCHVLDAANARTVAMVIGQAFSAAYKQALKANGVTDEQLDQAEYTHILNAQSVPKIEIESLSDRSKIKKLTIPKHKNDIMGLMVMESGYGSAIPACVIMNVSKTGAASRSGLLNVGDHILSINGINLVGMPRKTCIDQIKKCRYMKVVKMQVCSCPAVVDVTILRPDLKFQLGFSIHEGMICSLMRGSIAERSGVRVGHRIIEINGTSTVRMHHAEIVHLLSSTVGDLHIRTMSDVMYKLLTGKLQPDYC